MKDTSSGMKVDETNLCLFDIPHIAPGIQAGLHQSEYHHRYPRILSEAWYHIVDCMIPGTKTEDPTPRLLIDRHVALGLHPKRHMTGDHLDRPAKPLIEEAEVLEQQLWHLGCKLWEELAIYPNAMALGLSETLKQTHRGVYMLIHPPERDLAVNAQTVIVAAVAICTVLTP